VHELSSGGISASIPDAGLAFFDGREMPPAGLSIVDILRNARFQESEAIEVREADVEFHD
jgi:hypothetical protein